MSHQSLSALTTYSKTAGANSGEKFSVSWKSPSNIALVKYWGKKENQIPLNPSLSMTLSQSYTLTRVTATPDREEKKLKVNADASHPFIPKMELFLQYIGKEVPVLKELSFNVETTNSFPHSTGIASSASGLSAFALCLLSIAEMVSGKNIDSGEFFNLASFVSRMGSGSACRSLYGGYSLWGKTDRVQGSSGLFAVPLAERVHPIFRTLHDAILVISSEPKSLPSTRGHSLMDHHPFAAARIDQAENNLSETLKALDSGDIERLISVTENEALTLHALIMSSKGGTVLLKPPTVNVILKIREARRKGMSVFFSLDAGPNVHLFYPEKSTPEVEQFIRNELVSSCENGLVIYDCCGTGPVLQEI